VGIAVEIPRGFGHPLLGDRREDFERELRGAFVGDGSPRTVREIAGFNLTLACKRVETQ